MPEDPYGDTDDAPVHKGFDMLHQSRVPQLLHRGVRYQIQIGVFQLIFPFPEIPAHHDRHVGNDSQQEKFSHSGLHRGIPQRIAEEKRNDHSDQCDF